MPDLPSLENDEQASSYLTRCCTIRKGIIRPEVPQNKILPIEWHAIRYLCDEWDYAYLVEHECVDLKIDDLMGIAMDWAIAREQNIDIQHPALGQTYVYSTCAGNRYSPSTDWSLLGPILCANSISVVHVNPGGYWLADMDFQFPQPKPGANRARLGPSPQLAVLRRYLGSIHGDTISIPKAILRPAPNPTTKEQ